MKPNTEDTIVLILIVFLVAAGLVMLFFAVSMADNTPTYIMQECGE
jgi:nitrate reductase gamma subunit